MQSDLEEQLARTTQGITLLKRLLTLATENLTTEELQIEGMEMAVSVTRSGGGYLHFFDQAENVINLSTWSKSVHEYCEAETTIHYPLEYAGIWADSARQRATVVHNDYQSIPESVKGGLPEGHFPIYRHMSVPVFDHDKLVAIVGVGNKEEPYDETDILQMELLMSCLWSVLEQRRAHEILQRYSFEDGVTGIANRRRFNETLESEWARVRRQAQPLNLIIADIDFFKGYNDSYGHSEGDNCLRKVADTLQKSFRRTGELVTRYGGEEFAIICPYPTLEEAAHSAELARTAVLEQKIPYKDSPISDFVTISMGVACIIPRDGNFKQLIELADANLYKAKGKGRNRIVAE